MINSCMLAIVVSGMLAQTPPPASQPTESSPPASSRPAAPSLDELLNLDPSSEEAGQHPEDAAAERARREQLQRSLNEEKPSDAFEAAVQGMAAAADQLTLHHDPGIDTQRIQEDVLRRLDAVIQSARKKQQQQSSSSQSRSRSQPQQAQPRPASDQSQDGSRQQNAPAADGVPLQPPPPEGGPINSIIDESRSEWGSLPQRVREMIEQGMTDRVSPLYKRLTEAYYRRLAEESSK